MADKINTQPPSLDLLLYAGDGASFRVICTDPTNTPVDVSGTVLSQVKLDRSPGSVAIVSFSSDLTDAVDGIIVLSLTGEQTQDLLEHESVVNGRFVGVWDLQWTATASEPRTLVQGKVDCVADVTR